MQNFGIVKSTEVFKGKKGKVTKPRNKKSQDMPKSKDDYNLIVDPFGIDQQHENEFYKFLTEGKK